jgi:hypothetical protein
MHHTIKGVRPDGLPYDATDLPATKTCSLTMPISELDWDQDREVDYLAARGYWHRQQPKESLRNLDAAEAL